MLAKKERSSRNGRAKVASDLARGFCASKKCIIIMV